MGVTCRDLVKEICLLIDEYEKIKIVDPLESTKFSEQVNGKLNILFTQSAKEGYFFWDCSLAVYKRRFKQRLRKAKKNIDPDITEEQLYFNDYKVLDNLPKNRVLPNHFNSYQDILDITTLTKFDQARKGKIDFIQSYFIERGQMIFKYGEEFSKRPLSDFNVEIEQEEGKENIALAIAILHEADFFDLEKIKKHGRESLYNLVSKITGGGKRTVKGNILVLNPKSKEDRTRYTSNDHIDDARKLLNMK